MPSSRSVRVNELVKREISQVLHTDYKDSTVAITIVGIEVSPDLRDARVYYSVIGDEEITRKAKQFLNKHTTKIRYKISKKIVLKYLPQLTFIYDSSIQRGNRVLDILDDMPE
jgi:ribosome-binding factor A